VAGAAAPVAQQCSPAAHHRVTLTPVGIPNLAMLPLLFMLLVQYLISLCPASTMEDPLAPPRPPLAPMAPPPPRPPWPPPGPPLAPSYLH
jgi:quinol-cytochrome oxidoreductase complex cytochrome b subunit